MTEQDVYQFLEAYQREHGYSPTQTEIADGIGVRSKSYVNLLLDRLTVQGRIRRRYYVPRGSYIPGEPNQFQET
jgi:SOS-response transcriptional repressor LexA